MLLLGSQQRTQDVKLLYLVRHQVLTAKCKLHNPFSSHSPPWLFHISLTEPGPPYAWLGIQLTTERCLRTLPGLLFCAASPFHTLPHNSQPHCQLLIPTFNLLSSVRPRLLLRLHFPIFGQVPSGKRPG